MKDEHIIPLLHELDRPTFFTRDLGFADTSRCHQNYALGCLDVGPNEVARVIKEFLRHPSFNTKKKRMGSVIRASPRGLLVWRFHAEKEHRVAWPE